MSKTFKPGDRVVYKAGTEYGDKGTVIRMGTRDVPYDSEYVYVVWANSRMIADTHVRNVTLLQETVADGDKNSLTEESAVMFLLSRGYKISKGE